jgi:hypothetical protein
MKNSEIKGMEKGIKRGILKGRKEGIEKGIVKEKRETALSMLADC